MSAELDRIKDLVHKGLLIDAVEVPTNHKNPALITDDLHEALSRFDDAADYAHFVVRVKRSSVPLPKPLEEPQEPQLSIDAMVNETMRLSEELSVNEEPEAPVEANPPTEKSETYEPDFLFENAKILEENKEFNLSRNIYQSLIRRGTKIPESLAGLARTYEAELNIERAIRCYQEAIAYASEFYYYQALAALLIRVNNDEEASATLTHALGLPGITASQAFDLHKSIGNCFTRMGLFDKAEHHYRKAYELDPNSDILQVNVGSLALQKGELDSALKHFQKALEINAQNEKAISGLGMVYLSKGNSQKAYDFFLASLKISPNNLGTIYNLVKCAYELKRFDDAAGVLKKLIENNPVNTNILYSYAGILFHQGNHADALAQIEKVLETNPTHSGVKELKELVMRAQ